MASRGCILLMISSLLLCILQHSTSGMAALHRPIRFLAPASHVDQQQLLSSTHASASRHDRQQEDEITSLRHRQSRALSGPGGYPSWTPKAASPPPPAPSPKRALPTLPPPPPPKGAAVPPTPPSPPASPSPAVSQLWGTGGELYNAQGPLADVAWAGYRNGNVDPPSPPITFDLKRDFGAIGDGAADDTLAFETALNATPRDGVLYIPPGTYVLTRPATVTNKPIIIRGAGVDVTTLYYPYNMRELNPTIPFGPKVVPSPFNSGPFFLNFANKYTKWMVAKDGKHFLADITGTAARGDYFITVSTTKTMWAGQWVQLLAYDTNLELATYMYGGTELKDAELMANASDPLIRHLTTVKAVVNATCIQVTRPLPFDFRKQWRSPMVVAWNMEKIEGAGIEDLTARFPPSNYPGHLREEGYNWLSTWDHHHVFLRRLRIVNADFGMNVNSDFGTVENVTFEQDFDRAAWNMKESGGMAGHHAIGLNRARGVLVKNFRINNKYVHDLTMFTLSSDNVFKSGSALDLSIDYHKQPMHGNLFQNLDCGRCSRLYNYSGGSPGYGLQAGMYNTWWGLYSSINSRFTSCLPYNDFGANLNFIGLGCNPVVTSNKPYLPIGWTLENQNPHGLTPRDLHQAMRKANLNPLFPGST